VESAMINALQWQSNMISRGVQIIDEDFRASATFIAPRGFEGSSLCSFEGKIFEFTQELTDHLFESEALSLRATL
jgi:hypothetical protein